MSMLVPSRRRVLADPFDAFFDTAFHSSTPSLMRTDISESKEGFELTIDLPGFKKEDVQAELKEGYLTITAQSSTESEDKDEKGTWVRKERFSGKCSRSFYVGEDVEEDEIRAKFEDGLLKIAIPKKQPVPQIEQKHVIAIEG